VKAGLLIWYRLRWPRNVSAQQVEQAFLLLSATAGTPVVIETVGSADFVEHRLALPRDRVGSIVHQLRAGLPGLAVETIDHNNSAFNRAVELRLSTRRRPLGTDDPEIVSTALLSALSHLGANEHLVLQWVLGRQLSSSPVPNKINASHEFWLADVADTVLGKSQSADSEFRTALRSKQGVSGWQAVGRIGVMAKSEARQRQLIRQVLGALRTSEAPGVSFRARSTSPKRITSLHLPLFIPLRLNALELATVSGWPIGATSDLPVAKVGSRMLAPTSAIPKSGRIIGEATFPGRERPLAISAADSLRHFHVLGPTGSGKSTLLLNLVVQDMADGRGVAVIEPRGDLIKDILSHVPPHRAGDVVLLDPTDDKQPVGLNPLSTHGRSPELVADQLLGVFHNLYVANWGPRTQDILGSALLTLARNPGMTLVALPLLLTNAGFRRRMVASLDDPIGLEPFWASYENWSEAERTTAISPVMNKLRPFLLRPQIRAIIGQAKPRFDVRDLFTKRKILLVNLAKGELGPETAALLGSLVIAQLWQATLNRSTVAPEKRHPVFIYVDEFQNYLRAATDFADAMAQARGLGVGFVLAHQYMHQLDLPIRSAVMNNAQSRIAFRLPNEDAKLIAAGSNLEPEDFQSLSAYHCYVQLLARNSVQPWCSARTLMPDNSTSDPELIRTASRDAYGIDRSVVEAAIRDLAYGRKTEPTEDLGRRRRNRGDSL
ncbi:unnamed protein product, partial [Acidithrix sp. C25]